ncbi:TPA: cytidylate kinase-like family protein [bacterium UBP9_UBA11836]|nr:cytidylate kinase-like family protein [bacterium UBP9_UBA11836]
MGRIITVGREFGSGGRELGRRLAQNLGIAYYDRQIVTEIAKRTALTEDYVQHLTESSPAALLPISIGRSFYPVVDPVMQQNLSVYAEQHKLLAELAEKSDCVIVGRGADYILRDKKPFRIFVYADSDSKVMRCLMRKNPEEKLTEKEIKKKIESIDAHRAKYYEFISGNKWGVRENYDLMINTSNRDIKKIAKALANCIKAFA